MLRGFWLRAVLVLLLLVALPFGRAENRCLTELIIRERTAASAERRFDLYTKETLIATATLTAEKDARVFEIRDSKGGALALLKERAKDWGNEVFVHDQKGSRLGILKQRTARSLIRDRHVWEVRDGGGQLLTLTTPQDALTTELFLRDAQDGEGLKLERPGLSAGSFWKLRLSPRLRWDTRLVMALGLYRVATDVDRRTPKDSKEAH